MTPAAGADGPTLVGVRPPCLFSKEFVIESWRLVWREGFAPVMSAKALEALRDGLRSDDERLTQGSTTTPPPLMCTQDWPVEAGCCLVYAGWLGEFGGDATVRQVEEYFARLCFEADSRLGEPAACRWLLDWFDDTPREEMRRELLAEVERELSGRGGPTNVGEACRTSTPPPGGGESNRSAP